MAKSLSISLVYVLLIGNLGMPAAAGAVDVSPLQMIQNSNQQILAALGEDETVDPDTEARVYELMDQATDFAAMSGAAIRSFCDDFSSDKCGEFKAVFGDLLRIQAIKKLGRYRADRFEYLEEDIEPSGDRSTVLTIAFFEDDEVTLDYELELIDGGWMIVNYIVDGVDTVRNYQKQFTRLLARESVDDVIQRLRDKIAEFENS